METEPDLTLKAFSDEGLSVPTDSQPGRTTQWHCVIRHLLNHSATEKTPAGREERWGGHIVHVLSHLCCLGLSLDEFKSEIFFRLPDSYLFQHCVTAFLCDFAVPFVCSPCYPLH